MPMTTAVVEEITRKFPLFTRVCQTDHCGNIEVY